MVEAEVVYSFCCLFLHVVINVLCLRTVFADLIVCRVMLPLQKIALRSIVDALVKRVMSVGTHGARVSRLDIGSFCHKDNLVHDPLGRSLLAGRDGTQGLPFSLFNMSLST